MKKHEQDEAVEAQTLVVALHGAFLVNLWPNIVEVVVPLVPGHMYLVEEGRPDETLNGSLQGQRRFGLIDGGTFALSGVEDNDAVMAPDPKNAVVIQGHDCLSSGPNVFCRLLLPLPDKIVTADENVSADPKKVFVGGSKCEIQAVRYPSCLIFIYETVSGHLSFGRLPWMPAPDADGVVHLRLYAETIGKMGDMHTTHMRHAFDCLVSLLPGFDASIDPNATFGGVAQTPPQPPFSATDKEPLRQRLGIEELDVNPPADCGSIINNNRGH